MYVFSAVGLEIKLMGTVSGWVVSDFRALASVDYFVEFPFN